MKTPSFFPVAPVNPVDAVIVEFPMVLHTSLPIKAGGYAVPDYFDWSGQQLNGMISLPFCNSAISPFGKRASGRIIHLSYLGRLLKSLNPQAF